MLTLLASLVLAQVPDPGRISEQRHTAVLAGWTGANVLTGSAGLLMAQTPEGRTFHGTNLAWNSVNAVVVGTGALALHRNRQGMSSREALRRKHKTLHAALAVNLGLDVLYVGTGLALWGIGGEVKGADLRAIGQGLTLQGGFLLGFDASFLLSHRRRVRRAGRVERIEQ